MPITRDQIYTVANTLNAQGIRPTLAAVRRMLGAGSFTTISEGINEWKMTQSADTSKQSQDTAPELLMERLNAFGTALWSDAMSLAAHRFALDKEAIDDKLREKESYYMELEKLSEEYALELEAAKACIGGLRHELHKVTQCIASEQEDQKRLKQELTDSDVARKTLGNRNAELRTELDRAHQQSDQLHNNFIGLLAKLEQSPLQMKEKKTEKQSERTL